MNERRPVGYVEQVNGGSETKTSLHSSGVIFLGMPLADRQEALRQQRISVVPWDMHRAGAALHSLITASSIKESTFARRTGLPLETLDSFRQGGAIVDLNGVYANAVRSFRKEGDEQLRMLDRFRQNRNWLRTFTRADMDIAGSTELMLLNSGLIQNAFARRAEVSDTTLTTALSGRLPLPPAANGFLKAGGVHTDSMAAQYYRLTCRKRQPMSIDELQTIPLGKLVQNLRFMKGLEVEELGDLIGYKKDAMKAVEAGTNKLKEEALVPLLEWLELPEGSAMAKVIAYKYKHQPRPDKRKTQAPQSVPLIPDGVIEDVLRDPYLFQEHVDQIKVEPYPVTKKDERLKARIEGLDSVSKMLKAAREGNRITLSKVALKTGLSESNISSFHFDSHVPESYNIVLILRGISECSGDLVNRYDVHHPIVQLILNKAEKERNAKADATEAETGIRRRIKRRELRQPFSNN